MTDQFRCEADRGAAERKRRINRELRRGLWRAAREQWGVLMLPGASVVLACLSRDWGQAFSSTCLAIAYTFAIFFKNEAREGWMAARLLMGELKRHGLTTSVDAIEREAAK